MRTFHTLPNPVAPVRIVVVGAGGMGKHWLRTLRNIDDAEVVGLVDINIEGAREALLETGYEGLPAGDDVVALARASGADAIINVTVPIAHHPVNVAAMTAGYPVLCEKPIAPTVAQALSLAAVSEATGQLLMTSQSRRYYDSIESFRSQVSSLGTLGVATTEFFRAPRMTGFRTEMENPLLVDMSIHAFDAARYVLNADPVSVYCDAFNPQWSWFDGSAVATAIFEMSGGIRYVYSGSWCSPGLETSWNGSWRVSGERGTAFWDGEENTTVGFDPDIADQTSSLLSEWTRPEGSGPEIEGSFAEFVRALRTGSPPSGEIHHNIASLAMVEAAVRSARTGNREFIADLIDGAYTEALAAETLPEAHERLVSWGSGAAGLR